MNEILYLVIEAHRDNHNLDCVLYSGFDEKRARQTYAGRQSLSKNEAEMEILFKQVKYKGLDDFNTDYRDEFNYMFKRLQSHLYYRTQWLTNSHAFNTICTKSKTNPKGVTISIISTWIDEQTLKDFVDIKMAKYKELPDVQDLDITFRFKRK